MCGIVGYLGKKNAAPFLLEGLKKLEYRGYDSAGIAVLREGRFYTARRKGRVEELDGAVRMEGHIGIGHTRWATHGAPSERNAHPHVYGKFAVVHNGIIENYLELKEECLARGEVFSSETDSEVIAHLLNAYYTGDFLEAVHKTVSRLAGSYALAVLCADHEALIAAREKSPLVAGKKDGVFVASDIPAVAEEGAELYTLADGEFAVLGPDGVAFYDRYLNEIVKERTEFDCVTDIPDKKGYRHFMRKEMSEIPRAIADSVINFSQETCFSSFYKVLCQTEYIQIAACGTAYHSGIAAKTAIEALCRVPVEVSVASEYRYRNPLIRRGTMLIAVSQSGETADTLAAAERAKARGAVLVALTNAPCSSITRIADFVLQTHAGREIAVAATKSYNAQLAALYSLTVALAQAKGREADFAEVEALAELSAEALKTCGDVRGWTPYFTGADSAYFLGRGADYVSALEGSLKLKEISYLPSEGYPAGELKHGTLALIERGTPVVAVLTQSALAEKTMNAVHEVYARGGKVFLITSLSEYAARKEVAASVLIPKCAELFSPILSVIPLQALAYYTSVARGNDPDKPRNLAKSVTVE